MNFYKIFLYWVIVFSLSRLLSKEGTFYSLGENFTSVLWFVLIISIVFASVVLFLNVKRNTLTNSLILLVLFAIIWSILLA